MPSPFSSSQLWKRQIQRATTPGTPATTPVRIALAASILRLRPKEMKKLLTGARKNANKIAPKLLYATARRYRQHAPVIAEIARCLRDQDLAPEALAILRSYHADCSDPTALLKPWPELIRTADNPSPDDSHAFQLALERGIHESVDDPPRHHPLCQFWIDHRRILPAPSTVTTAITGFLSTNISSSLAENERDLLNFVLSRPGTRSATTHKATGEFTAIPSPSPLLIVCAARTTLTSLQDLVTQLENTGHPVRTFCLDCLDRRDIYWSDHVGTRPHKEPAYAFLGDQRLSSLRLLTRLLEKHRHAVVPDGDPAIDFLACLPENLRPAITSTAR